MFDASVTSEVPPGAKRVPWVVMGSTAVTMAAVQRLESATVFQDTMAIDGQTELPKGVGSSMTLCQNICTLDGSEVTAKDGVKLESAFLGLRGECRVINVKACEVIKGHQCRR